MRLRSTWSEGSWFRPRRPALCTTGRLDLIFPRESLVKILTTYAQQARRLGLVASDRDESLIDIIRFKLRECLPLLRSFPEKCGDMQRLGKVLRVNPRIIRYDHRSFDSVSQFPYVTGELISFENRQRG